MAEAETRAVDHEVAIAADEVRVALSDVVDLLTMLPGDR